MHPIIARARGFGILRAVSHGAVAFAICAGHGVAIQMAFWTGSYWFST